MAKRKSSAGVPKSWPYDVDGDSIRKLLLRIPQDLPQSHPFEDWLRRCASLRKWQLFACACVRQAWERLSESGKSGHLLAERYADGEEVEPALADLAPHLWTELQAAQGRDNPEVFGGVSINYLELGAAQAVRALCRIRRGPLDKEFAHDVGVCTAVCTNHEGYSDPHVLTDLSLLLHDIFGMAAQPEVITVMQSVRDSQPITALARDIYASRDFGALPKLADALAEAGCKHPAIVDHCRGPGPHVRGCWVIDLVIGNE